MLVVLDKEIVDTFTLYFRQRGWKSQVALTLDQAVELAKDPKNHFDAAFIRVCVYYLDSHDMFAERVLLPLLPHELPKIAYYCCGPVNEEKWNFVVGHTGNTKDFVDSLADALEQIESAQAK